MASIGRSNRTVLVVGFIAVLALSTAAATIDSAVILNPGDIQSGTGTQQGSEQVSPPLSNPQGHSKASGEMSGGTGAGWSISGVSLTACVGFLASPIGILAGLVSFVLILYAVTRVRGVQSASLAGYALGPIWFFGYFLLTDCAGGGGGSGPLGQNPISDVGGGGLSAPQPSPLLVGGAVGVAAVLVGALLYLGVAGDGDVGPPPADEEEEVRTEELAEAAGRAADRITNRDAAVDNAVYRAWYEMTQVLDLPNPETCTPGEFEAAAVEAGMAEESVSALTRLFDEVRYGDMDPSERESQALDLLRRIESEYGEGTNPRESSDGESEEGA